MYRHTLFSDYYLDYRKERNAHRPSAVARVEGTLAVAPESEEKKRVIISRMSSRTWWENGWNR
jgi:hypothetical protein